MKRRKDMTTPDVVAEVARQTEQAQALAQITGQDRLADPRMNPAVRRHADRLRNAEQVKTLDAQNARVLRRHRVADKRAAHAEKTLEVLQAAKQASSPARSVMALHRGRTRFLGLALAASMALSAGSATGPGDLAHKYANGHDFIGWIAEMGLTGLSTMAIMYRSHLGEHGGAGLLKSGSKMTWQAKVLWLLVIVPLTASIVANAVSHGFIGVCCSIGAAAFGLFAHVISDQSSAALQARAGQVTNEAEAELHAAAMGLDTLTASLETGPATISAEAPTTAEIDAEALAAAFAAGDVETETAIAPARPELFTDEALAAWLNEPPEAEGGASTPPPPDTRGPQGAARALPASAGEDAIRPGVHIDGERPGDDTGGVKVPPGVGSAARARRAAGEQTRARVAAYMAEHPDATAAEIAAALALHRDTVKRHRRDIRRERNSY